jgi:hypothetical protein
MLSGAVHPGKSHTAMNERVLNIGLHERQQSFPRLCLQRLQDVLIYRSVSERIEDVEAQRFTETFFEQPVALLHQHQEAYSVLRDFYALDPAE